MEAIYLDYDFIEKISPCVKEGLYVATIGYNGECHFEVDEVLSFTVEILKEITKSKDYRLQYDLQTLARQTSFIIRTIIDCKEKNPKTYYKKIELCSQFLEDFYVAMSLGCQTGKILSFPCIKDKKDLTVYTCVYNKELEKYEIEERKVEEEQ